MVQYQREESARRTLVGPTPGADWLVGRLNASACQSLRGTLRTRRVTCLPTRVNPLRADPTHSVPSSVTVLPSARVCPATWRAPTPYEAAWRNATLVSRAPVATGRSATPTANQPASAPSLLSATLTNNALVSTNTTYFNTNVLIKVALAFDLALVVEL